MKKKSCLFCFIVLINIIASGCDLTTIPLKSKYNNSAVEITTNRSADSVWTTLTQIFTTNGLPIKKLDKEKGAILTRRVPINALYSIEKEDGQLEQPEAWVALVRVYNKGKEWKPEDLDANWNIKVAEAGGITKIRIDPLVICTYFPNSFTRMESSGQSTGKLERILEKSLNGD